MRIMKKIFILAGVFVLFSLPGFCQSKKIQDIIGRWTVIGEQGPEVRLEIIDSADIMLTYLGEEKKMLNYKIDFSKSPAWFDFSVKDTSSSMVNVKSIIEIINDGLIKWQLFVDENRPDHFSSGKGELFYLKKEKVNTSPNAVSLSKE
jgi:hypothetical protein